MNLELVDTEAFSRPEEKGHRYQSLVTYVRGEYGDITTVTPLYNAMVGVHDIKARYK